MDAADFRDSPRGRLVPVAEGALAFVPDALPRAIPLGLDVVDMLDEASRAVARLDGVGETLPNPGLLSAPFLRREAVLSSRIEGTQASVSDVYEAEATGAPRGDAREVLNYVDAAWQGAGRLGELPICVRLARELHAVLLDGVRGQETRPGELREAQVWIGSQGDTIRDARFVPPPPDLIPGLLADWEAFVHDEAPLPPLVRCALMHYQFEAIHPFRDGNGRIGRLLIPLLLMERGVLRHPLLYLSAWFERHRQRYYDGLYAVSASGDWTPWLRFFLEGVREQAADAVDRARKLRGLHEDYRRRLLEGRASANALRLADELPLVPVVSRRAVASLLGVTPAGASLVVDRLAEAGILQPLTGGRPRLFAAHELLDLIG